MVTITREDHDANHFVEDAAGNRVATPRMGCEFCQESVQMKLDHTQMMVKCTNMACDEYRIEKTVRMTPLGNNVFSLPRPICGGCGHEMIVR